MDTALAIFALEGREKALTIAENMCARLVEERAEHHARCGTVPDGIETFALGFAGVVLGMAVERAETAVPA